MAFSSGTYSLPGAAINTGDTVSATENNTLRNDMATAFNLTWLRNGTAAATANIPLGGFKLTGLGNATTSGDALPYGQAASIPQSMLAANVAGNGPAFSAYGSALQSFSSGTFTKVAFNTKEFDTNTNFDTTNNRFTPTIAGYYLLTASFSYGSSALGAVIASVYKNGSEARRCFVATNNSSGPVANISTLIYANGSTDYFEIYGWQNSGGALNCGSANSQQCFTGFLARAA